jgi:hypothetical protein
MGLKEAGDAVVLEPADARDVGSRHVFAGGR